jgi:acyl-coenzyme A synthetase/AMP-(fatty) acid ligase
MEWFNNTFLFLIDHWWQTESGWPMIANSLGIEKMPVKSGSATKAVCGYDIKIFNENGDELKPMKKALVVVKPLPPGNMLVFGKTKHVSKLVISANLTAIICLAMEVIKMKTDIFSSPEERMT